MHQWLIKFGKGAIDNILAAFAVFLLVNFLIGVCWGNLLVLQWWLMTFVAAK